MGTEEDTFKKLKQYPFETVLTELYHLPRMNSVSYRVFLQKRGWELEDFRTELCRHPLTKLCRY